MLDTPPGSVGSRTAVRPPVPTSGPKLARTAVLNGLSSLLDFGSTVIVGLFITPILIRTLDNSLYGVWKILQQLVGYMDATDGRPTQALKWVIANQQHADDKAKRTTVSSACVTYAIYLPLMAAVGAGLVWVAPSLAKVPPDAQVMVRITCALLVLTFILMGFAQLPAAVLRGENQGYRRMGLGAVLTLAGAALTVGAALLGLGLVGIASAQVLVAVGTGVFFSLVVKRYLPWYGFSRPSWSDVRRFLGFSNWFFVSVIVNRLVFSTDVVILAYLTAPAVVTTYTVTEFASVTTVSIVAAVVGAVVPGLGRMVALRQHERLAAVRGEIAAYSWLLATVIGSTTLILNRSFIHLWVGTEGRYAGPVANLLIVLLAVQLVFIRNQSYIIDLSLQLARKVMLGLAATGISTVATWLLIPSLGIVGLALGLLLGRMVLIVAYPILVRSYLGGAARWSPMAFARQAGVMVCLFALGVYLGERILVSNWLEWVAAAALSAFVAAGVCIVAGLSTAQRRKLLSRVGALTALRG